MTSKYEKVIQKQEELIKGLEEQHAADQALIDAQKHQIHLLEEKLSLLEKEQQALIDAGNEMSATCEKLEKICSRQQELIDTFSNLFPEG